MSGGQYEACVRTSDTILFVTTYRAAIPLKLLRVRVVAFPSLILHRQGRIERWTLPT